MKKPKVKKSVTFGGVSYIEDIPYEGDDDQVNWQIEQDEQYARQLQNQEQSQHVGLQRRGTGRPTPNHSAPQNVNFSVLTPQQYQVSTQQNTSTPPPPVQQPIQPVQQPIQPVQQQYIQPPVAAVTNNQLKPGFEDDAWAPRAGSSPLPQQSRSISSPARSRPTPQVSQQSMVDPELLAKWSGSPALAAANSRPVPPPPVTNNFAQVQQQQQQQVNQFAPVQQQQQTFVPAQQQQQAFVPAQQQNTFTPIQQQQNTANTFVPVQHAPLQQQSSFSGTLQPNNSQTSLQFQQHSPMMSSFQSSPSYQNVVPLQTVLPTPLIPQPTANTSFTPPPPPLPSQQSSFNTVQPQMTGRHWTAATPDNPFGSVQPQVTGFQQSNGYQPSGYQQPQYTGFQQASLGIN
jgi:hypothetical protein